MKKILLTITAGFLSLLSFSQDIDKVINAAEVERIEKVLSADDMQGRKTFTPGIDKAADFIAQELGKLKLKFFGEDKNWFQEFSMIKTKTTSAVVLLDHDTIPPDNYYINSTSAGIDYTSMKGLEIVRIKKEDDYAKSIQALLESNKNLLVLVDTAHAARFKRLRNSSGRARFSSPYNQVFILTGTVAPNYFELHVKNDLSEQKLKNVVAVLPGKTKKDEYVVFSGHYDHLGIGKPDANQDSIYNGANDDAAGTTCVMMLANYFSQLKNNERTIIFVAFTAEEIGGFGSRYFSKQLNPDKVMAMFNIEMIGTESKWGTNSAYITGYEKSDMGKILQANLADSKFHFEPDPYPKQNLFYRSDNRTLAELGVPAHTISTSKMDSEKYYHTQGDEIQTLDMNNMAEIIKAIAISSKTIISGKDTPTRVELKQ
jgi:hypothetical protein